MRPTRRLGRQFFNSVWNDTVPLHITRHGAQLHFLSGVERGASLKVATSRIFPGGIGRPARVSHITPTRFPVSKRAGRPLCSATFGDAPVESPRLDAFPENRGKGSSGRGGRAKIVTSAKRITPRQASGNRFSRGRRKPRSGEAGFGPDTGGGRRRKPFRCL